MIYAGIVAGGVGRRMGCTDMPKQFMLLGKKPILIHTIEKFMLNNRFHKIYVGVASDWLLHAEALAKQHILDTSRLVFCEGGTDRNGTIMNIMKKIDEEFGTKEDDVIVTHDAVRPFVTHRIIEDNINRALKIGACDTVAPASDTMTRSIDGVIISEIPNRSEYYHGQTPQSFNMKLLQNLFDALSDEDKENLTDACKICVLQGKKVAMVQGGTFNIKITTPYDLLIANAILQEGLEVD